jgi:hypothetical protein
MYSTRHKNKSLQNIWRSPAKRDILQIRIACDLGRRTTSKIKYLAPEVGEARSCPGKDSAKSGLESRRVYSVFALLRAPLFRRSPHSDLNSFDLLFTAPYCLLLLRTAFCCSVLLFTAPYCFLLLRTAFYCSVLFLMLRTAL